MASNGLRGVLTIIFGLILLVFPWFGLWTLAAVLGFVLILVGLGLLVLGAFTYRASKAGGAALLVLGILGLAAGIGLFGNVGAFAAIASIGLYLSGFILIASGLVYVIWPRTRLARPVGFIGILLGVAYLVLGSYATEPQGLSLIMGIWLIIAGVTALL